MKVSNIHSRILPIPLEKAGQLIDSLASKDDLLWPRMNWPSMRFDRSLSVGATGGHGPIRYSVTQYDPGRFICFTFSAPKGFNGTHSFELECESVDSSKLTHAISMDARGGSAFRWWLVIRPLHDAFIEDALSCAEKYAGTPNPTKIPWSFWVKILRALLMK